MDSRCGTAVGYFVQSELLRNKSIFQGIGLQAKLAFANKMDVTLQCGPLFTCTVTFNVAEFDATVPRLIYLTNRRLGYRLVKLKNI